MAMKVYLAARFTRLEELLGYKAELEAAGIEVTSRWLLGGHEWVGTADEDMPVEFSARCAGIDLEDMNAADGVVCFTEASRSGPARGGRHVEFGYALACGMNILAVGHRENVFYCLPEVELAEDWPAAKAFLVEVRDSWEARGNMTPQELAGEVAAFIQECQERITGIGAEQYHVEGEPQKFETMPLDDLFEYYEEELRDICNYAVMAHIRLRRLRIALGRRQLDEVRG